MGEEKLELWLIRHGETEWSLDGRHTSVTDIPLTERGRERARELRDYLAGKKFAAVFVSPMQRAKETCEIAGYGDVAIVDSDLMEWNYGESEGKTTAEMRAPSTGLTGACGRISCLAARAWSRWAIGLTR